MGCIRLALMSYILGGDTFIIVCGDACRSSVEGPQLLLMQLVKASFDPRGMTQGQSKNLSTMWKTLDSVLCI